MRSLAGAWVAAVVLVSLGLLALAPSGALVRASGAAAGAGASDAVVSPPAGPAAHAQESEEWVPSDGPVLGLSTRTIAELEEVSDAIGVRPAMLGVYADFTDEFPARWAREADRREVPLLVSWEPWDSDRGYADQPEFSLARVASGAFDAYVRQFARDASASEALVVVRFAPEMNGDWQVWHKGESPSDFVAAFRHVHDVFASVGAHDVLWAFTPINPWDGSVPFSAYWPGLEYVDWVGVDGYTWQTVLPGRSYEAPVRVFDESVRQLRALAGDEMPLVIAETGSAPGRKADFVRALARYAPSRGIDAVVWFERVKETDWRLSSSALGRRLAVLLARAGWSVERDLHRGARG